MATILAVDDSQTMRQMIYSTLKQGGHKVYEAFDGQDALNKASLITADLVLADVNMPRMNGITLIEELRKIPEYKFTPILLLTTETSVDMKSKGKLAGATGWMVKPFDPNKLLSTIDKVLA